MDENLTKEYRLRFGRIQQYRESVWAVLVESFFQELVPPNSHILEIGCGWGEFLNHIRASRKIGIDINTDAKDKLAGDIDFINQDCSDAWPVDSESLDVVFTGHLFEHLPAKSAIEATVVQAYRCLKQGGSLICLGPNIRYSHREYWDFWDHRIPLSERSLGELLEMHDFTIKRSIDRFLPYSMAHSQPPLIFLKLYLAMPFVWRFWGKQFLIIATK